MMLNTTHATTFFEGTFADCESIQLVFFQISFVMFLFGIPFVVSMKIMISLINLIEDLYIDYISYKFFFTGIVLPDLGERKNWCKKTDWTVEWKGHQRLSKFRNFDGTFIYTNTKTNEEYTACIDDGPPEDSF